MIARIKPCPECGSDNVAMCRHLCTETDEFYTRVQCIECGLVGPEYTDFGFTADWGLTAVKHWNTRL